MHIIILIIIKKDDNIVKVICLYKCAHEDACMKHRLHDVSSSAQQARKSEGKKTEDASFQNSNFSTVLLFSIDETE